MGRHKDKYQQKKRSGGASRHATLAAPAAQSSLPRRWSRHPAAAQGAASMHAYHPLNYPTQQHGQQPQSTADVSRTAAAALAAGATCPRPLHAWASVSEQIVSWRVGRVLDVDRKCSGRSILRGMPARGQRSKSSKHGKSVCRAPSSPPTSRPSRSSRQSLLGLTNHAQPSVNKALHPVNTRTDISGSNRPRCRGLCLYLCHDLARDQPAHSAARP